MWQNKDKPNGSNTTKETQILLEKPTKESLLEYK